MKPRKTKTTDDQIEAEMLARRDDPLAWEALPFVPPSTSPRPAWMLRSKHLELAARFHILSVLHRLGVEANLALGQPDNVDITVLGKGGEAVTIDVKTVEGKREWLIEPFHTRKHHFVVVVAFESPRESAAVAPHTYVFASEDLNRFLSNRKGRSISLDVLSREMHALDAWQQLIKSAPAA